MAVSNHVEVCAAYQLLPVIPFQAGLARSIDIGVLASQMGHGLASAESRVEIPSVSMRSF